ncbi:iron-sulfur cluster assembly accessory protein, partial [Nocardia sp. CC201C]
MTVQNETTTHGVTLTDAAASKAKALLDQEGRDDLALRIAVQPGGCAGLRYQLFFDDRSLDGDLTVEFGGVNLVVDRMSAPYVQGAAID